MDAPTLADSTELVAAESARFLDALTDLAGQPGGLTATVPPCPEWTARSLAGHLAGVQRFWAAAVRAGGDRPPMADETEWEPAPEVTDAELLARVEEAAADLVGALRTCADGDPCFVWWEEPATVAAVGRHQVQEATVHRIDAELAAGRTPAPMDPIAAADGVAEFAATCGRWHDGPAVRVGGVVLGTGEPVADIDGDPAELVLALYGRRPFDGLTVTGDRAAVESLVAALDTT